MDNIIAIENLGNEIAKFMDRYGDHFEIRDIFDSFEELTKDTISSLYDSERKMEIMKILDESIDKGDDDEAVKAAELYRKVKAL